MRRQGQDSHEEKTSGNTLTRAATCCGVIASLVVGITAGVVTAPNSQGHVHEYLSRTAAVLIVATAVFAAAAWLDRRGRVRDAGLRHDVRHYADVIESMARDVEATDVRHLAAFRDITERHERELREASERHDRELRIAEDRHERDIQHHLHVLEQVLADRSQAEARAREQGRLEMQQIGEIRLTAFRERLEAEFDRSVKAAVVREREVAKRALDAVIDKANQSRDPKVLRDLYWEVYTDVLEDLGGLGGPTALR